MIEEYARIRPDGMRVQLRQLLTPEVLAALRSLGFEIVKVGEIPYWLERVESIPAELYRKKLLVED